MDKNDLLISLFSYAGNIVYYPFRTYKKRKFDINKINRVLIVAYYHGIGTFILLLPLLKTLKKNIPRCRITLLVDSEIVAELAGNCPYIYKIMNKKGLSTANLLTGIKHFKREIAPHKYDLVISTIYERTTRNPFWAYFSGATYRISFDKRVGAFLDTLSFKWDKNIHEVENYLEMLENIGCRKLYDDLCLKVSPESIEYADRFMRLNNIYGKDVILGIHPGAKKGWSQKIWPLERFVEVADRFSSEFNTKIIFFGGPDEDEIFLKLARLNHKFILANNQTITQTAALIKRCNGFLTNDSGLMHIAALYGIPTVAIFGPTNPKKNRPWRVPHKIIAASIECSPCYDYSTIKCQRNECMESILPDQVFPALKDFYNEMIKG